MPGRRSSSSSGDAMMMMMFDHDARSRSESPSPEDASWPGGRPAWATSNSSSSSSSLPLFSSATPEKRPPSRRRSAHSSACLFAASLLCFGAVALALVLGLGLCGPWRHGALRTPAAAPSFNSSAYYGIPDDLPTVDELVNARELDLDTDFFSGGRRPGVGVGSSSSSSSRPASPAADSTAAGAPVPRPRPQPQVREYEFNVSQALGAPDGFRKPMILVNGQSPGPLVEANVGDTVRVHVHNRMADWSTAIHWHGIDQRGSTWMDGVASVSQCAIPPGRSFTYEFKVTGQRGTFWWHAHLSVQYSDGLYGPLVIHDPDERVPEVDDDKIIFVGDVYHTYGAVLLASYLKPTSKWTPSESGVEPLPDNILMNGQNVYNCSVASTTYPPLSSGVGGADDDDAGIHCTGGRRYATTVRPGDRVRLRLINSSSFLSFWFSVDSHNVEIVELDGVEIEPIPARGVYLNIGQRVSVIVTANQTAGRYALRASLPQTCFLPYSPYSSAGLAEAAQYAVEGVLAYEGYEGSAGDDAVDDVDVGSDESAAAVVTPARASTTTTAVSAALTATAGGLNVSNPYGVDNNRFRGGIWEGCDDMPFDMPKPMRPAPAYEVSENNTHYIEYVFRQAQDVNRIFINKVHANEEQTAYAALPDNATLWKAVEQRFDDAGAANAYSSWDFGLNQQVLLVPDADAGAQIVINSRDDMEHPWHLHGHTFQVVGWGKGYFGAADSVTTWNLDNPMRRDTVTVPALNHVVLRFRADNPGLWALHCHVAWHIVSGMFVSLAERPRDLARLVADMDPATRQLSQSFCGVDGGQAAFGPHAAKDEGLTR
ncbi:multicopper oxidase-domain-containing protein [Xylariaceae sp. FL0804]|nr:multicopper oxidase-domain-containing protein [Xylariaceae sp. FL0804]